MVQSHSSSPLAEQFPNSSRLCQSAFKVAKIVLSQFVSDKQQIREAETSKIIQEMMLEILVTHLERVCGLDAFMPDQQPADLPAPQSRCALAKAIEDTNLEEIVQLLKLLQEVMRISSAANRALAEHQMAFQQAVGASTGKVGAGAFADANRPSQFLSEGSVHVMRCAKLLAYLMVEYEVPVVVRHAVRCARIFFFGLVDFHKLVPFKLSTDRLSPQQVVVDDTEGDQIDTGKVAAARDETSADDLASSCPNRFLVEMLRKIGQRVSGSQDQVEI